MAHINSDHAFGGVADGWWRDSGCIQLGDQAASPKYFNRVAGSRAVRVAKCVAAQLADTDPVLHLFSLSRQKRWGRVDFATSAGSNREPGHRRRHAGDDSCPESN